MYRSVLHCWLNISGLRYLVLSFFLQKKKITLKWHKKQVLSNPVNPGNLLSAHQNKKVFLMRINWQKKAIELNYKITLSLKVMGPRKSGLWFLLAIAVPSFQKLTLSKYLPQVESFENGSLWMEKHNSVPGELVQP